MSNQVKGFLKDWVVPPGILRVVFNLRHQYSLLRQNSSAVLSANSRFHGIHAGKRCFVIGNGPSLNSQDLGLLKKEITYTCNAFYLHPILSQWQPRYHSHVDPRAFDGSVDMTNWFRELCEKMPNTKFFLPLNARDSIVVKNQFPQERTYYCAFTGKMCVHLKSVNITRPIPSVESASLFGIALAMYMGCNPIYLIGMDHDFLAAREVSTHFYNTGMVDDAGLNFDRSAIPYDKMLRDVLRFWGGYRNLKKLADSKEIKIYNATNGGFLDVFERVEYESLHDTLMTTEGQSKLNLGLKNK
jgi:hypothetical protein